MPQASITLSGSIGSIVANGSVARTGTSQSGDQLSGASVLAAAQAGSLTTRTSDTAGVVTTTATPTITDADKACVAWAAGTRINMTVTDVTVNAITLTGGDGDVLPAGATAVTISKVRQVTRSIVGDNLTMLFAVADKNTIVAFYSAANALLLRKNLPAKETFLWALANPLWVPAGVVGGANPLAGVTVAYLVAGCAEAAAGQLSVGSLANG
jgi:hypothetical protein